MNLFNVILECGYIDSLLHDGRSTVALIHLYRAIHGSDVKTGGVGLKDTEDFVEYEFDKDCDPIQVLSFLLDETALCRLMVFATSQAGSRSPVKIESVKSCPGTTGWQSCLRGRNING